MAKVAMEVKVYVDGIQKAREAYEHEHEDKCEGLSQLRGVAMDTVGTAIDAAKEKVGCALEGPGGGEDKDLDKGRGGFRPQEE